MMKNYEKAVATRYHIYNSLFLNLPFHNVYQTGTLLPLLQQACEQGYKNEQDPVSILERFFSEYIPDADNDRQFDLLFNFIQYIERQIVLFDSIEDAAFSEINNLVGPGTISALLLKTKTEDKLETLKSRLDNFHVRVVLTAHPTQFYPGNVLGIINDLSLNIESDQLHDINLLLHQLGKTPIIYRESPTPFEEAVGLCWYLENVFYHVIPQLVMDLIKGLALSIDDWNNDKLLNLGFWPGGDRDGNPFVTSTTTLEVAAHLKETILKCYHNDLRILRRRLTFSGVEKIITKAEQTIYQMAYGNDTEHGYKDADEFLQDLISAKSVLLEKHDGLFVDLLDLVILKARIFGFYFASMDIRQDSRKHELVWDSITKLKNNLNRLPTNYAELSEPKKVSHLLNLELDLDIDQLENSFEQELLCSFSVIGQIQASNGPEGCHRYVISNTRSVLDIIYVFVLVRQLLNDKAYAALDIVPLFETIEDLAAAPKIMSELYAIAEYRKHLNSRGNRQTIMLGFSDGTKDGGYLQANWSIYRAKENLTNVTRDQGFEVVFFDGRGGPPGRGGGNTHDFYASLGKSIAREEVQVTVQGQTVSSNFGRYASCRYNLEQLLCAGIENNVFESRRNLEKTEIELLESLAVEGYKAYLELKEHPKFVSYLQNVTPLSFFAETKIGSRPVKRGKSNEMRFEDLRAIPFVGSWAQMKQNVPGFYGVGSALLTLKRAGRLDELKTMYRLSLFFRTLLSNSMMSLTKSFFPATAYLLNDKEYSQFWQLLHKEYELSKTMILEVSELPELMSNNPANRDSVKLREKIVLPLITIQQFALQHLRNLDKDEIKQEAIYKKLVLRCMFGIINAGRNVA